MKNLIFKIYVSLFLISALGLFEDQLLADTSNTNVLQYVKWQQQYTQAFGPTGDHKKGEIEIVLDPKGIEAVQQIQFNRLLPKWGHDFAYAASRVGIVAEDAYWIWVRDPVIFPSGAKGTYDRLLWRSELDGAAGVIVLPMLSDGSIILNVNYRHATRSWELELPRGMRNSSETPETAARRELLEETGCVAQELISLGQVCADSGALSSTSPVFLGKISEQKEKETEFSEAIEDKAVLSLEQLQEAFSKGYIEIPIKGEIKKVRCRDALTTFALFQAMTKGILKPASH